MKTWQSILLGIFLGILFAAGLILIIKTPSSPAIELQPTATYAPIVVQVAGEVVQPGLYQVQRGARIQDAIEAAGGFTPGADQSAVNLASRLKDGDKINIPALPLPGETSQPGSKVNPVVTPTVAYPLDLNAATLEELDSLPGIGPTRAQDIIDYRIKHGGFKTIEEIKQVTGIGDATFDRIKDLLVVVNNP